MSSLMPPGRPSSPNSLDVLQTTQLRRMQAEMERERARRAASNSLEAFIRWTNPDFEFSAHHYLMIAALERVERGEIDRLLITMAPRHGKSETATRRFVPWYFGRHPKKQVILGSYNDTFAEELGRDIRNVVGGAEYQDAFPGVTLSEDSKAAGQWRTNHDGRFIAAGFGGGVTGRGAHLLVCEDPFKDASEADNIKERERVWRWFTSTAYTRQMETFAVVVVTTRWHDDDLAGRLIRAAKEGGDRYTVVNLPALIETEEQAADDPLGRKVGEALWPERYPADRLRRIKANLYSTREWSALYQGEPVPDSGDYFRREWFRYYDEAQLDGLPLRTYGASDYAVTDDGGDWTVHMTFSVDWELNLYVRDLWRKKANTLDWVKAQLRMLNDWQPEEWGEEADQIKKSVKPFRDLMLREANWYKTQFVALPSAGADKARKARSIQGRMEQGKVFFPRGAAWLPALEDELLRAWAGEHDDQGDTLGVAGRMLDRLDAAMKPPPPKGKIEMRWPTLDELWQDREDGHLPEQLRRIR